MRRSQVYPYQAPVGGVNKSLPPESLPDQQIPVSQNVSFVEGYAEKRKGYTLLGTSTATSTSTDGFTVRRPVSTGLDTSVMGMQQYRLFDGTEYVLAASQTALYKYDAVNEEWDSLHTYISGTSTDTLAAFTGTNTNFFYMDSVYDAASEDPWIAITNGLDAIAVWKGSNEAEVLISTLASSATLRAKYLLQFKNYLMLLHTIEGGNNISNRVRWSDTADPADFDNGNASYLDLPGTDPIVGGVRFKNDYVVVGRENALHIGHATGDSDIFQFEKRSEHGCLSGRTMVDVGEMVLYLGRDDVYAFDGAGCYSIGGPIREDLLGDIDYDYDYRCFAVKKPDQKEYWLFVPIRGYSGAVRFAWVYNYAENKWTSRHFFADDLTVAAEFTGSRALTIGDLAGLIGDLTGTIGDWSATSDVPLSVVGDSSGQVYKFDNTTALDYDAAINSYFETKDFVFNEEDLNFRVLRIDVFWEGTSLTVSYSEDNGETYTALSTLTSDGRSTIYTRLHTDKIRFKFSNTASSGTYKFRKANFRWQPAGDRL